MGKDHFSEKDINELHEKYHRPFDWRHPQPNIDGMIYWIDGSGQFYWDSGALITMLTTNSFVTLAELRAATITDEVISPAILAENFNSTPANAFSAATPLSIEGGTTQQLELTSTAGAKALNIACTDQTVDSITASVTVNSTNYNFLSCGIAPTAATGLSAAEQITGTNFSFTFDATDADTSIYMGHRVHVIHTSGGRADATGFGVLLTGARDTGDTSMGLTTAFGSDSATYEQSDPLSASYGMRIMALSPTTPGAPTDYFVHTNGIWYGVYVNNTTKDIAGAGLSYAGAFLNNMTDDSNSKYGVLVQKSLTNNASAAGVSNTRNALQVLQTSQSTGGVQKMTVNDSMVEFLMSDSSSVASADEYSGTAVHIGYSATATAAGDPTNTSGMLVAEYSIDGAGLTQENTKAVLFSYATENGPTYTAASTVSLLDLNMSDGVSDPIYGAGTTLNALYIDTSGIHDIANLTIYGINVNTSGMAAGSSIAAYFADGTNTVTICDGTSALSITGSIGIDSIDITPSSNIDAIDIIGTNITTAHLIDLAATALTTGSLINIQAITTKTSGYLYNGSMTTSVLDATTILDDFSVSTAHDGLAADTLMGTRRTWSGAIPNAGANANLTMYDIVISSTVGSGGAEGGTIIGYNANLTGMTVDGTAVDIYGGYFSVSGLTRTNANSVYALYALGDANSDAAIYAGDGTQSVVLADGTNAILAVGPSVLPSVSSTPATNIAAWSLTGTNITTADAVSMDLQAKTGGSVFDIDVYTSTLDASTIIMDIVVGSNHDGVGADVLVGQEISWSGNVPNGTLNSDMRLNGVIYSGTWGSGGAEGGTLKGFNVDFTGATLNGSSVESYGYYYDSTGLTDTSSQAIWAAKYILGASTQGIYIDADTTAHTARDIIYVDLDVNSANATAFYLTSSVDTLLSAGEIIRGIYFDMQESVVNAATSQIVGSELKLTCFATAENDMIGHEVNFGGTKSGAAASAVFGMNISGGSLIVNNGSTTVAGVNVDLSGITNTASSYIYGIRSIVSGTMDGAIYAADSVSTVTIADGTWGMDMLLTSSGRGINIDAGTTSTIQPYIIYADVGIKAVSLDFIHAVIEVDNALAGKTVRGTYYDINEKVLNDNASYIKGMELQMTAFATSKNNLIGYEVNFDGSRTDQGDIYGLHVNADSLTLNHASPSFFGVYVDASGMTNTNSLLAYGGYFLVDSTADAAVFASNGSKTVALSDASNAITATGNVNVNGGINYASSADGTDTYTATIAGITSYATGMVVFLKVTTANTGACTLNVNAIGAKAIKDLDGNDPQNNDIVTTGIAVLVYDGTNFVLCNPVTTAG